MYTVMKEIKVHKKKGLMTMRRGPECDVIQRCCIIRSNYEVSRMLSEKNNKKQSWQLVCTAARLKKPHGCTQPAGQKSFLKIYTKHASKKNKILSEKGKAIARRRLLGTISFSVLNRCGAKHTTAH